MGELTDDYVSWMRQQRRVARQTPDQQAMTHAGDRPAEPFRPEPMVRAPVRFMGERYEIPGTSIPERNAEASEGLSQIGLPQGPGDLALGAVLGPLGRPLGALTKAGVAGAGLSLDPERAEAMFAGLRARRPPMGALKQAEVMRQGREPPAYIHDDTGIHYGVDGNPRWELDDSRATRLFLPKENAAPRALQDVWDHPELWAQYPDIGRDIGVEVRRLNGPNAAFYPQDQILAISPMAPNPRRAIAHETQHAIQDVEGWAPGASQDSLGSYLAEPVRQRMLQLEGAGRLTPDERKELLVLSQEYRRRMSDPDHQFRLYRNSAGEVEARNAEERLNWDDWERAKTPPWSSADTEASRQIVHPTPRDMMQMFYQWRHRGMPTAERDRLIQYARDLESR